MMLKFSEDSTMLKKMAFAAAMIAATPALAGSYVDQYRGYFRPHWHHYPNYAAFIPYGWPMVPSVRTMDYVPEANYALLPVRVYFIPQEQPYYNAPPYEVVAPY
jgi:hypothetical protein